MIRRKQIRTRIAPSPTGLLHIGTARTALFNYLFAKKMSAKFILRFEDTDQKRSTQEYEEDILEGLKWLGLEWDEGPFYQMKRLDLYKKYADQLIKSGRAYKKEGAVWFDLRSATCACLRRQEVRSASIEYNDLIHGKITFPFDQFNDFVIIKKDGIPTFLFGNAIDDHEEKISYVIRGEDHITNTPQQILIYRALGWQPPQFAHIPLILNKDRSKMSKRKDPVSISKDFRDKGYLPEAMINYMALLGWNPKDNREFFTLKELEKEFDLSKVNKSGAIFDIEKLNYFNGYYIRKMGDKELAKLLKSEEKVIHIIKDRLVKLSDFESLTSYLKKIPKYPAKLLIFKKSSKENTLKGLKLTTYNLQLTTPSKWGKIKELNNILLKTVKDGGLSNGDVFWPVRVALSGLDKSPSPAELLWVLGKEESLKRVKIAINKLE